MDITYIIGNGFDRQIGLASAYSDFLQEYIKSSVDDNENIKDFKKYLSRIENKELWSNAEFGMGQHIGDFSDKSINDYIERILDFEEKMIDYLTQEQDRCSFENEAEIKGVFTDFLFNSYQDVLNHRGNAVSTKQAENYSYSFVSFNYTNILDTIIKKCVTNGTFRQHKANHSTFTDQLAGIYHVHGTLDNAIIMGVNDESQLRKKDGLTLSEQLRWTIIKPRINMDSGNSWDAPAKKAISKSAIVAIYGVSFGDTDRLWWDLLKEWLKADNNHRLIWFVHDSQTLNSKLLPRMISYDREKRTDVLNKLGFTADDPKYDDVVDQVYIIRNTKRLDLERLLHPNTTTGLGALNEEYALSV